MSRAAERGGIREAIRGLEARTSTTPAMAAGVGHVWKVSEIVALLVRREAGNGSL